MSTREVDVVEITNPEGAQTIVTQQLVDDEKYFEYKETNIPGIYAVTVDEKLHPQFPAYFPVNVDVAESNLGKINHHEIETYVGGTNFSITTSHTGEESDVLFGEAKKTLWGHSLLLTLFILFIESFISRKYPSVYFFNVTAQYLYVIVQIININIVYYE